jgi:hypothetical protein
MELVTQKTLLILPGATDPNHMDLKKDYNLRYNLVANEAKSHGFDNIEILSCVGQKSGSKGLMNLVTASELLTKKIIDLEKKKKEYDIIAFSWGANVYLYTLSCISEPKYLKRTVLWGIDEFWRMASFFTSSEKIISIVEYMKQNGSDIDPHFMSYEVPNEVLLIEYKHENVIRIGFGENDPDSPPAFAQYLKTLGIKRNIKFRVVPEVSHVVTCYNEEYLRCLFEDIC